MNIIEATKKALKENKAITTPEDKEHGIVFVPTNSMPLGIVIVPTEPGLEKVEGIYKEKWTSACKFWNPKAEDLLRDDWELF